MALIDLVFGGDTPQEPLHLHQIAARAAVVYIVGVLIVRIGKSRLLSRATALDVILGFILGSLLSRGMTGHASISGTAVASAALVFAHWAFTAASYHWHGFGALFKGTDRILIRDGEIDYESLRKSHISENDLLGELRAQGVDQVEEVASARKERNGEVSVIVKKLASHIVDINVADGVQVVRLEVGK